MRSKSPVLDDKFDQYMTASQNYHSSVGQGNSGHSVNQSKLSYDFSGQESRRLAQLGPNAQNGKRGALVQH